MLFKVFISIILVIIIVFFGYAFINEFTAVAADVIYTDVKYSNFISIVGSVGQSSIDTLIKELEKLPDDLLDEFISNGNIIYLTDLSMSDVLEQHYNIVHRAEFKAKGIFIVNKAIPSIWLHSNKQSISKAVIHEFAHWVDYSRGRLSKTEEFLNIYNSEKNEFKNNIDNDEYFISSPEEYFSESFSLLLLNPEQLREHCPATYMFYSNVIKYKKI